MNSQLYDTFADRIRSLQAEVQALKEGKPSRKTKLDQFHYFLDGILASKKPFECEDEDLEAQVRFIAWIEFVCTEARRKATNDEQPLVIDICEKSIENTLNRKSIRFKTA